MDLTLLGTRSVMQDLNNKKKTLDHKIRQVCQGFLIMLPTTVGVVIGDVYGLNICLFVDLTECRIRLLPL